MKKNYFITFLAMLLLPLELFSEPLLGLLQHTQSNNLLYFKIKGNDFTCKNYGIIMIDEIVGLENTCKTHLNAFIAEHPEYHYFSQTYLKRYQQYHLDILDSQCLLYAQGRKSLSELLLENGLAVRDEMKRNIILDYKFQRSVTRAQREKKGIYSDAILRNCVNVLK